MTSAPARRPAPGQAAKLISLLVSSPVLVGAARVSLIVGTMLNVINQRDAWQLGLSHLDVLRAAMNYLVPFSVSAYSAAVALLARNEATHIASNDQRRGETVAADLPPKR